MIPDEERKDSGASLPPEAIWVCFVDYVGLLPKIHHNYNEAREKAKQLALLPEHLGRRVHILRSIEYCQAHVCPVKWDTF